MDTKSISFPTQATGTTSRPAQSGAGSATGEQHKVDALNALMGAMELWQTQRSDMARDIKQVWICLLRHPFTNGRLDLIDLQGNEAAPKMPSLVWKSLREMFSAYGEKAPAISLPACFLEGWPARHTVAALKDMAPVSTLHIDLPSVASVDLSRLGQGTEQPPPQTIHVSVSTEHAAGRIQTDLIVPRGSLVLGSNPGGSVTVVQDGQRVPLGTGSPSSSSSSSSSSTS